MKAPLPIFIVTIMIGVSFSLAACKKEDPSKDAKKKISVTKEKTDEEVQY